MTYDPYQHATQLGINIGFGHDARLDQHHCDAIWLADQNAIVIRPGLTATQERCLLAHELAHAALGHRSSTPKHEVLADRYAAELLVDRDALVRLMETRPGNYAAWAADLGVTTQIMRMYLNVHRLDLERRRDRPYRVAPMTYRALG